MYLYMHCQGFNKNFKDYELEFSIFLKNEFLINNIDNF